MALVVVVVMVMVVIWAAEVNCYDEANTVNANKILDAYEKELLVALSNSTSLFWDHLATYGNYSFPMEKDMEVSLMDVKGKYQQKILHYLKREQRVRPDTRRRLQLAVSAQLNHTEGKGVHSTLFYMAELYDTAASCSPSQALEFSVCQMVPDNAISAFTEEMNTSKLINMWESWHSNISEQMGPSFISSVYLLNKAAKAAGERDYSEEMLKSYEGHLSKRDLVGLYLEIQDLYELLHSYVRRNLFLRYPDVDITITKAIPVTLLGDLFGRFWGSLYHDIKPYRAAEHRETNITAYMEKVEHNITWMFKWVEQRYTSMGLKPLPPSFFEESALTGAKEGDEKKQDCRPSAWEMYKENRQDYRIYMCTEATEEYLQTIIHLMGHIQYYQHYANQPLLFRKAANEGLHEAIAGLFTLVYSSPAHFFTHGFPGVEVTEELTKEREINYLFRVALTLLPAVPYLLSVDVWRWKVYEGLYQPDEWNCEYWKLRQLYTGVLPTTYRGSYDLDMLPTYQLAHTTTATKHYTALFMQFMMLESLCDASGHKGSLHTCDLFGSEEAGRRMARAMGLGSSRAWPEVLRKLTGADHITAAPLKRYFQPLTEWLTDDGLRAGGRGGLGWGTTWRLPDEGRGGAARSRGWQVLEMALLSLLTFLLKDLLLSPPPSPPPPPRP